MEHASSQLIELTRRIASDTPVRFDPETSALAGVYADELAVYRAKRGWRAALETHFLLEAGHDFTIVVVADPESNRFLMRCEFVSACAKSAFWRITHQEAPEAQCLIETAHIPYSESHFEDLVATPDMTPLDHPEPFIPGWSLVSRPSWLERLWRGLRARWGAR